MALRPVEWGPGYREKVRDWLDYELTTALNYRSGLENRWRKRLEYYRAPADQPLKRFPYEGASNLMLPMIATDVDQMFARLIQTIHAADNIWSLAPLNESWVHAAKPMQDFLQLLDQRLLKMYGVNKRALLEMVKLGTAIYKTGWHYEKRKIGNYQADGPRFVDMTRSIPTVDHVRLVDFLLPSHALAINPDEQSGAEWVGERLRLTPERLRSLARATEPFLPNFGTKAVDDIIEFVENDVTQHRQKIRQLDYTQTGTTTSGSNTVFDKANDPVGASQGGNVVREIELWEIHARCETRSGQYDDVVLWYHRPTQTILRDVYHYYPFAGRPYDVVRYFPGDGFYGIGMCEQLEVFQSATSDTFNFMLDNMLLGNSIGIAAKAGSNIGPGEPIYPGMVKITDGNPRDEFMPFKLGDINPGILQSLELLQGMAQRRDGIGDLQQGQINDVPGRTPATTIVSLLQEGSRRPDLTIKDLRYEGLANVGLKVLQYLQANANRAEINGNQYLKVAVDALGMPEGAEVAQQLAMPLQDVELGLAVGLTATSGSANKEVNAQRYTQLLGMMTQVGQALMGYAQAATQFPGTLIGQTATNLALGTEALFQRVLEQNDIRDPEAILSPATPEALAPVAPPLGAGPGPGGGGGQAPVPPGGPGMGGGAGAPVRQPAGAVGQPAGAR